MQVQELRGKLSKNLLHEVKMYALLCFEIKLMHTLVYLFICRDIQKFRLLKVTVFLQRANKQRDSGGETYFKATLCFFFI